MSPLQKLEAILTLITKLSPDEMDEGLAMLTGFLMGVMVSDQSPEWAKDFVVYMREEMKKDGGPSLPVGQFANIANVIPLKEKAAS